MVAKTDNGDLNPKTGQVRRLTKTRRAQFLATLAISCNVSRSCREAGLDFSNTYKLRARDPAFAREWEDALAEGYLHLEGELLHRALGDPAGADNGAGVDAEAGAATQPPVPFDADLALKLLAQRQRVDTRGRRAPVKLKQPNHQEVLAALDRKLTAMEKRLGTRAAAPVEAVGNMLENRAGTAIEVKATGRKAIGHKATDFKAIGPKAIDSKAIDGEPR